MHQETIFKFIVIAWSVVLVFMFLGETSQLEEIVTQVRCQMCTEVDEKSLLCQPKTWDLFTFGLECLSFLQLYHPEFPYVPRVGCVKVVFPFPNNLSRKSILKLNSFQKSLHWDTYTHRYLSLCMCVQCSAVTLKSHKIEVYHDCCNSECGICQEVWSAAQ